MDAKEWKQEMVQWLCCFSWCWFCTLTFRPGLSEAQARWRLKKWLGNLHEALGTPDFGYFAVREFGRTRHDLHFHVLVKGLFDFGVESRIDWMRSWQKIGGDSRIDPFNPGPHGPQYILKNVSPDDANAIDFDMAETAKIQPSLENNERTLGSVESHDEIIAKEEKRK